MEFSSGDYGNAAKGENQTCFGLGAFTYNIWENSKDLEKKTGAGPYARDDSEFIVCGKIKISK